MLVLGYIKFRKRFLYFLYLHAFFILIVFGRGCSCVSLFYLCYMTEVEILQIQNEIYTKIVIDELQKQKGAGKPIGAYVLDKLAIDIETKERLKKYMASERNAGPGSISPFVA